MSETPDPAPPPAAPATPPASRTPLDAILAAAKDALPSLAVSAGLIIALTWGMPAGNEKVALSLISGLFGFLTGRATASKGSGQ